MEGELSKEEFEEANSTFRDKICEIEENLRALASTGATANSFVRFAELQLTDLAHIWRIANPEQRERVQNLLFEGGLDYSPKSGFLNRCKSSLFNALKTVDPQNTIMVDRRWIGSPRRQECHGRGRRHTTPLACPAWSDIGRGNACRIGRIPRVPATAPRPHVEATLEPVRILDHWSRVVSGSVDIAPN
jgi:hypothetical protein